MNLCGLKVGLDRPLFLIAGPCAIESEQLALDTAGRLKDICARLDIPFIYKSSFDKANRSSEASFRGLGIDEGLRILAEVKRQIGVPVLTDVHEDTDIEAVAAVVDVRVVDRDGGYTRILRLATPRLGDAGQRALLEFVGEHDRVKRKSQRPAFEDDEVVEAPNALSAVGEGVDGELDDVSAARGLRKAHRWCADFAWRFDSLDPFELLAPVFCLSALRRAESVLKSKAEKLSSKI